MAHRLGNKMKFPSVKMVFGWLTAVARKIFSHLLDTDCRLWRDDGVCSSGWTKELNSKLLVRSFNKHFLVCRYSLKFKTCPCLSFTLAAVAA